MDTLPSINGSFAYFLAGKIYRPGDNNSNRLSIASRASGNAAVSPANANPSLSVQPSLTTPWVFKVERNGNDLISTLTAGGVVNRTVTTSNNTGINAKTAEEILYAGLAVTDHETAANGNAAAQFRNLKINGVTVPLNQAQILD